MEKLKKSFKSFISCAEPSKWEFVIAAIFAAVIFSLFSHPDIMETSNHTWLFLDNLFSGNVLGFYENVFEHSNSFYYVNAAHYNILVYIIMGIWQLPVYIIHKIFSLAPNEYFLMYYTKLLCAGLAVLCGWLTGQIALIFTSDKKQAKWQLLMFVLSPLTLLSVFVMGQYDVLCLALMLWAFLLYAKKRYTAFSLVMGAALCCKFFAAFWLLPLLLLCEKRILHLLKYAVISLWLYVPTALLFAGRDGDMSFFNSLISERMFSPAVETGAGAAGLLLLTYAVLAVVCRLYRPKSDSELLGAALYSGLAAFALLFLFVSWHPQWLVLLVPFMLLAAMRSKNKATWVFVDIIIFIGAVVATAVKFPAQIEANMVDFGLLAAISGVKISGTEFNSLSFYFSLLPYLTRLAGVMLGGGLLAYTVLHFPKNGQAVEGALCESGDDIYPRVKLWAACAGVFAAVYFLPVLFEWLKAVA